MKIFASRVGLPAFALAFLLLTSASLPAADYFITNKPGSGAGTLADPFGMADLPDPTSEKLKSKALEALQPGDTLSFREGDYSIKTLEDRGYYYLSYLRTARPGEPEKRITIRAFPGEKVRLIHISGTQPMLGGGRCVTFEGFTIETGPPAAARIGGEGMEIAWCHIKGMHLDTADNHDGLRIESATDCRIHHNVIEGVTGRSQNSAGIKLYRTKKILVEDNFIHGNTAGIFDKDSGIDNTYRRNFLTANRVQFYGNNQGQLARYFIYENVIDGEINLHCRTNGCEIHNNLVRADALAGAWAGGAWNNSICNNIVISAAKSILAFYDSQAPLVNEGNQRHLIYMDYNVYTAPPVYSFGLYSKTPGKFSLAQIRGKGYEVNSQVVSGADEIFENQKTWALKPQWAKAGKDGEIIGPRNIADVLDLNRYGPAAWTAAAGTPPREQPPRKP